MKFITMYVKNRPVFTYISILNMFDMQKHMKQTLDRELCVSLKVLALIGCC